MCQGPAHTGRVKGHRAVSSARSTVKLALPSHLSKLNSGPSSFIKQCKPPYYVQLSEPPLSELRWGKPLGPPALGARAARRWCVPQRPPHLLQAVSPASSAHNSGALPRPLTLSSPLELLSPGALEGLGRAAGALHAGSGERPAAQVALTLTSLPPRPAFRRHWPLPRCVYAA